MPDPAGEFVRGEVGPVLQLTRELPVGVDEAWALLTESHLLEQWIARWERDLDTGRTWLTMIEGGAEAAPEEFIVHECTAPRHLTIEARTSAGIWYLRATLAEDAYREHVTGLVFHQRLENVDLGAVGPGWEYYLDRLVAVAAGGSADAVAWEDYHSAMAGYYSELEATLPRD
ncbi:SRPBCC domain-containing protein [uncultured Demequina sp.]|uniref:SRPBCC domain-containing protein n=1 Tax=uncultured Demequina sp. TaxID=693499 RepID=UPI0025FD8EAB|nr:SRPBCC domain-containing protein [uncultured Demequina sp.]